MSRVKDRRIAELRERIAQLEWMLKLYDERFCSCGKPPSSDEHSRDCAVPVTRGRPWAPPAWAVRKGAR